MTGYRLTQSGYDLLKKVQSFGDFIFALEQEQLTHISGVIILCTEYEGVSFLEHRYLSTKLIPFKEISKQH